MTNPAVCWQREGRDANRKGQGKNREKTEYFHGPGKGVRGTVESYRAEITAQGSHEARGGRKRKGKGQAALGWCCTVGSKKPER